MSRLFSLPAEILDLVFARTDYGDRWCFALSCKDAARYATSSEKFLGVVLANSSQGFIYPRPALWDNLRSNNMKVDSVVLAESKVFREVMRLLSKDWVDRNLHWCDQCRRFRRFPSGTRDDWYGQEEQKSTVEGMRKAGGWVQDIGLSVDGLICWSHSCPPCAQRWWKNLPSKVKNGG
jgi:hypothetical protein